MTGAWFSTAIEHFSAPDPTRQEQTEDGATVSVRDSRTAAQRRADALGVLARLALGSPDAGTAKGGEPPRIVVHAGVEDVLDARWGAARKAPFCPDQEAPTPDPNAAADDEPSPQNPAHSQDLAHSQDPARLGHRGATCEPLGPIGPRLLGRLACDAVLQKVLLSASGAVLDLGRDTRTVSRAQRRALTARDRGCAIPGCSAPPERCEAHHVVWWRSGGRTDIGSLALVCGRDHTLIHLGIWDLVMIDGSP